MGSPSDANLSFLNFISDDEFRDAVASDFREMEAARNAGAWKCVVVMAGSIIETLLVDHLLTLPSLPKTEEQLLRMELGPVIETCKNAGILSSRVEHLSVVVKDYRNLIHAGRVKRLGEKANKETADISVSLLKIIVDEVSEKRLATYGVTAEQALTKLLDDPKAFRSAYVSMLPKMHANEMRKLVTNLLPAQFGQLNEASALSSIFSHSSCQ